MPDNPRLLAHRWAVLIVFAIGSLMFIAAGIDSLTVERTTPELRVAGMVMFTTGALVRLHGLVLRSRSGSVSAPEWAATEALLVGCVFFLFGMCAAVAELDTIATDSIVWVPNIVGGAGFVLTAVLDLRRATSGTNERAQTLSLIGASAFLLASVLGLAAATSKRTSLDVATTMAFFLGSTSYLSGSIISARSLILKKARSSVSR